MLTVPSQTISRKHIITIYQPQFFILCVFSLKQIKNAYTGDVKAFKIQNQNVTIAWIIIQKMQRSGSLFEKDDPGLSRADNLGNVRELLSALAPKHDKISWENDLHGNRKFVS